MIKSKNDRMCSEKILYQYKIEIFCFINIISKKIYEKNIEVNC